jgi:hypothetical protein
MNNVVRIAGDAAGIVGAIVCLVSGVARLLGQYEVAGTGAIAVFTVGMGLMVFACMAKLHLLTMQRG